MAILNIVKEGDDTLRKVCRPVTEITPRIIRLLDDMKETLEDANGAGLAAPQVRWKAVFQFPTYGDTLTVRLRS